MVSVAFNEAPNLKKKLKIDDKLFLKSQKYLELYFRCFKPISTHLNTQNALKSKNINFSELKIESRDVGLSFKYFM